MDEDVTAGIPLAADAASAAAAAPTILPGAAIVGLEADDSAAVLRALSARLTQIGAVTDSFEEAVLRREERQPTGMPTLFPAAIPHTDPEHVLTPGFAIAVPRYPVPFGEVGSEGRRTIWAEVVVMLLLADADSQLGALQRLVRRFQDPAGVEELLEAADDAELEERARRWLAG